MSLFRKSRQVIDRNHLAAYLELSGGSASGTLTEQVIVKDEIGQREFPKGTFAIYPDGDIRFIFATTHACIPYVEAVCLSPSTVAFAAQCLNVEVLSRHVIPPPPIA